MKGLEISEASFSQLERTRRVDSEYFRPECLTVVATLKQRTTNKLTELVSVSDGNHFSISDDFCNDGIPYYRGQDVVANFFMEQASPVLIPQESFAAKHMLRSHLKKGDVLLSIVGTIGEVSLYTSSDPATCSCKLAILRPATIPAEYLAAFLRSRYGYLQVCRLMRGAIQMSLLLEDMDRIMVPRFSTLLERQISALVCNAQQQFTLAQQQASEAQQTLLRALGLEDWQPPEPLTYTRTASDAFAAARFDAEYFAPRVEELLDRLKADGLTIADVAPPRHEVFAPAKHESATFEYIEIGGMRNDGTATSETVACDEAPSRASQKVHVNDIVTSTVRPIRRLSAIITADQDGHVCSSGFVVLEPKTIAPEVLLTYLRLPIICELMDLHTSASLYPAISERDLLKLPIPKIDKAATQSITQSIRAAHAARHQARELLERAKRAVEVSIEEDEAAGMKFIAIGDAT